MLAPAAKPTEVRRCACTAPEQAASAAKAKVVLTMMRFAGDPDELFAKVRDHVDPFHDERSPRFIESLLPRLIAVERQS